MKWTKRGLIFAANNNHEWMVSHAQVPVAHICGDVLRIYFGTRDARNRTVTSFIEVQPDRPGNILYVHNQPVLSLGALGAFDDSGAMPSWIVPHGSDLYLYYIGWNVGVTVPYRNALGLAISEDGGITFGRLSHGPILDRTVVDPFFIGAACVHKQADEWKMWYQSTVKWVMHDGHPEPYYHLRYAESRDGVNWERKGLVCIDFKSPEEGGITRPSVVFDGNRYLMWYSYRSGSDYRTNKANSYRIGYAESWNGVNWIRMDDQAGIDTSAEGWDSTMTAYPCVYSYGDNTYMLYNGNGCGRSGIGYAVLER